MLALEVALARKFVVDTICLVMQLDELEGEKKLTAVRRFSVILESECHWTKQCPIESPQAPIACLLFCWRLTLALSEISQPQKKYKLTECTSRTTGRGTKKSLKEPNSFFSRAIKKIKTKIKKIYTGTLKKNWREFLFDLENYMAPLRNSLLTFCDALSALCVYAIVLRVLFGRGGCD